MGMNRKELDALLVEQSEDYAQFVVDPQGVVMTWNLGAELILGWRKDEAIGRDVSFIFTPEDREAGIPQWERERATQAGKAMDDRWHLRKNGSRIWINGVATALRDASGDLIGFSKIMRDNTDARTVQEAVRESEARFHLISEALPDMAWTAEPDGQIDYMNTRWQSYTGTPPEDGMGFRWLSFVHPDDRETTQQAWERATTTGRTYEVQHRVKLSDGSYCWFITRGLPLRGEGEQIIKWVGTSTDIHQQRLIAQQLANRAKQQAVVVELGRFALAGHEPDEVMHEATRRICETLQVKYCKILQYLPDENGLLLKAGVGWPEDEVGRAVASVEGTYSGYVLTTNKPVVMEDFTKQSRFARSKLFQAHNIVSCAGVPIKGIEGPYGVLSTAGTEPQQFSREHIDFLYAVANILSEVVRRKALEEQRWKLELGHALSEQLERERRRVGRELHDGIRQQLIGVKMLAQGLHRKMEQQGFPDTPLMQEFIDIVGQANAQVRELINGLVPPQISAEYLTAALERLGRTTEQWYGILCTVTAPARVPVTDDEMANHLYYLAQEAMTNAAKHSKASQIDLVLRVTGDSLMLYVHDNGVGLPEDYDQRGSHGITNMRQRAELTGAEFTVSSGEHKGTTVTCILPLHSK